MTRRHRTTLIVRAERDIEVAGFLDGFAALVEHRADEIAKPLASAVRGLASSIRAGIVDDGFSG